MEINNDLPKFSMYDVMQAAKYFDEVYFPQSMIDNNKKQIANF